MGVESKTGKGLSLREIGSVIIVTVASAYLALAHILPHTDAYVAANVTPEVAGKIILFSRFGAALISSVAGASAAWVTSRFQKK